ncbi:MAG TPA: LLM class flavin-dependent oxidoreductase, partial [Acidimicrobiales bacterium]|nr:LLM class flavin-dependent oxidoreductase [Acidimicrobiales bacterium]
SVGERLDRFAEACAIVRSLSTQERTTFHGEHYHLTDAPMEPKPVGPFPLLVGGGGERRTLRIAAEHAQEWNVWSTPEIFAHKSGVLDGHCQDLGRDPAEIHRSTQALLFLSDDQAFLDRMRGMDMPMPTLIGTPSELVDVVGAYREAGVDELIVPDFTIGTGSQRTDILDRFKEEVAIHF